MSASTIEQRYQHIKALIQAAQLQSVRPGHSVTLIAVSKGQSVDAIQELYDLGHRDFGENYAQELLDKASILQKRGILDIRWHFIGHLQTNKVKKLIPMIHTLHTLDSTSLLSELAKQIGRTETKSPLPVFIEINVDDEENKSGTKINEAELLVRAAAQEKSIKLEGLMCIPSPVMDMRSKFSQLREMERHFDPLTSGKLSMGMSGDFELAIQEGATHIRIGTALFGPRKSLH